MSGKAFAGQPIAAATIGSADVEIDSKPLVGLGGDFWHTPYPIGEHGSRLIRVVTRLPGILESNRFTIGKRYLAFRLGGSGGGGVAIELRIPEREAKKNRQKALDAPDADGYVAVRVATPTGSDVLREITWDLDPKGPGRSLVGVAAKVRLRVQGVGKKARPRRLLVDHVRLAGRKPSAFHPPLWGWADIHCHPMAQAGFGDVLAGHMHGPVEDLGSCLPLHGHEHTNVLRPVGMFLEHGRHNDGSLATTGWTTTTPGPDDEMGFRGWPAFNELTHIKTHQDWIRRAYDGGQRLMVALVVHNQMLATLSTFTQGRFEAQSDRDTVEPQVQMLREFVVHNADWCGLATTPGEARALIEHNKMAFVLGLETDSINGWVKFTDFPQADTPANRAAIHTTIHDYFAYLRRLGIVQVNLIHLSDNAFGGMAVYDVMFMVNSWQRTGRMPPVEDGFTNRTPDERISKAVTLESKLWSMLGPALADVGITPPLPANVRAFPLGDRNAEGLTVAGEEALLEAMRLGMVIDMDHMSEKSSVTAHTIATKQVAAGPYPLVAAHNGARKLAPRPLDATQPAQVDHRRNHETWPSEAMKSETQIGWIKETGGIFGHGIAGSDSIGFGSVPNDCVGSSKTFAQGYQYLTSRLEMPVALGTDWNALLPGPGPRFGPQAASGLEGEMEQGDAVWKAGVALERAMNAAAQTAGVLYSTPLRDWRAYRFPESDLYDEDSHPMWQALALVESGVDLTRADVIATLTPVPLAESPALELALGLTGMPGTPTSWFFRAGQIIANPAVMIPNERPEVRALLPGLRAIRDLWTAMRTGTALPLERSTAGPVRDFDYNIDGLSHYGLLPDMLQDLRNVGMSPVTLGWLFRSAERYIGVWERSVAAGSSIPHP